MTLDEMATEIANECGMDIPAEDFIAKRFRIGSSRAGLVLDMVRDKVTTKLTRMMGPGRVENSVREWMR